MGKDFLERIIIFPGKGYSQNYTPFNKGCYIPKVFMHINTDIKHFSFEINLVFLYFSFVRSFFFVIRFFK
jgi:hypothetical protein